MLIAKAMSNPNRRFTLLIPSVLLISCLAACIEVTSLLVTVAIYYGEVLIANHGGKLIEEVFDHLFINDTQIITVTSQDSHRGTLDRPIRGELGKTKDGVAVGKTVKARVNNPRVIRDESGGWKLDPDTQRDLETQWRDQSQPKQ